MNRIRSFRSISLAALIAFSLPISGCIQGNAPALHGLEQLRSRFQAEGLTSQVQRIGELQAAAQKASRAAEALPKVQGKATMDPTQAASFVETNQDQVETYLTDTENQASDLRQFIFETSKEAELSKDPAIQAQDDALVYYALQLQAQYHRQVMQVMFPVILYLGSDPIKNQTDVAAFRAAVGPYFFQHFGAQMVSENDSKTIIQKLDGLESKGELPTYIETNIQDTQIDTQTALNQEGAPLRALTQKMSADQQAALKSSVQKLLSSYENTTFLYSTELHFNAVENLLVVIGNLTWGALNTVIGGCIVAGDGLAAALTLGQVVSFPHLSWSSNGHMIHVEMDDGQGDLIGAPGEMSLGLFELDNGGEGFASGHEGIHAVQSDLFGPFYLPTVLVTYAISGFDQGFMENWADNWAWMD